MNGHICVNKNNGSKIKRHNIGFSMVELIIVIGIMAVLAAALAPALIKYIAKTRKATDISNAAEIGKAFTYAMTENEAVEGYYTTTMSMANRSKIRIVAFMNAPSPMGSIRSQRKAFVVPSLGGYDNATAQTALDEEMRNLLGMDVVSIKFEKDHVLDEWIICGDPDGSISVYIGSGCTGGVYEMSKGATNICNGRRCYKLWPEVDPEYEALGRPADAGKNNTR